jgi:hypothetical protein
MFAATTGLWARLIHSAQRLVACRRAGVIRLRVRDGQELPSPVGLLGHNYTKLRLQGTYIQFINLKEFPIVLVLILTMGFPRG